MKFLLLSLALPFVLLAQGSRYQSEWADTAAWYTAHISADTARVDVFYVVSTEVLAAADGGWRSTLTAQDRAYMLAEMQYIDNTVVGEEFNYYAPYYHQLAFAAFMLPADSIDSLCRPVCAEVREAFRYYLDHWNGGRRFILMGFSQGAMFLTDLLDELTEEEYRRFEAAYLMGYRLSAEDLARPRVRAARGELDRGVCISFNSVFDTAAVWPLVAGGAAACINPTNWATDGRWGLLSFGGDTLAVRVDTAAQVLKVAALDHAPFYQWMEANPYFGEAGASKDCLHHWDILFYNPSLRDNIRRRTRTN